MVLERKFSWNSFKNNSIFFHLSPTSSHLHPLQVDNCDSNSRLVVDEDDNRKLRLERVKTPFNCKTGMRGTVTCRPTLAYRVQGCRPTVVYEYRVMALKSATKLITRYFSNETLTQSCFNVGPASQTLNQHSQSVHWLSSQCAFAGSTVSQFPQ